MNKFSALIFDCDGVLVNSEEIVQDIELELLAEHGLLYDKDEYSRRFLGTSNAHFYQSLNEDSLAELGLPLADDFPERLHTKARQAFETELIAFTGVDRVVEGWSSRLAVASSSSVSGLEYKLTKTNLKHHFGDHIYSAEHVGVGKPDPAIYVHTAEKLGVKSDSCIVVEDSVNGVISGCAAGMLVIGFTAGAHCMEGHADKLLAAGAKLVVDSMDELHHRLNSESR